MPAELFCGDFMDILGNSHWDTVFADPPDNIGLKYSMHRDYLPDIEYFHQMRKWILTLLNHTNTLWLSFNARYTVDMGSIVCHATEDMDLNIKPCVQVFTFGQHNHRDLGNNHRPLWRFTRPGVKLYTDPIRIKSWRQEHGDKRADSRGRVPGDVFYFPRVTGNSKQRRRWHPTQLHEGLVERCLRLTTPMGGTVLDPFAGTGTVLRVCERIGLASTSVEIDPAYCEQIVAEHKMTPSQPDCMTAAKEGYRWSM